MSGLFPSFLFKAISVVRADMLRFCLGWKGVDPKALTFLVFVAQKIFEKSHSLKFYQGKIHEFVDL